MEDFSGEIRKNVNAFSMHKPSKSKQTWTLLFIGSHGKTITFKRFKGLFIFFMIVLFLAIGAAAGLYLLYDIQVKSGKVMKSEIEALRTQIAKLKRENELLMARAVLAESKLQSSAGDTSEKDKKKASETEKSADSLQPSESLHPELSVPESPPSIPEDAKEDVQKSDKKKPRRNR